MHHLILSQPSIEYANAISHELWMLSRPRGISANETSQNFCGVDEHDDGRIAIGPLDQGGRMKSVHADADELAFAAVIGNAVTEAEEEAIIVAITEAKGGSIDVVGLIEASPSLSPNLRTREQLDADGWFATEEV